MDMDDDDDSLLMTSVEEISAPFHSNRDGEKEVGFASPELNFNRGKPDAIKKRGGR